MVQNDQNNDTELLGCSLTKWLLILLPANQWHFCNFGDFCKCYGFGYFLFSQKYFKRYWCNLSKSHHIEDQQWKIRVPTKHVWKIRNCFYSIKVLKPRIFWTLKFLFFEDLEILMFGNLTILGNLHLFENFIFAKLRFPRIIKSVCS